MPNTQPILPAEGVKTDMEQLFISEQPPNLFPENQNSNFGALRKLITDELQEVIDQLLFLSNETFIKTSTEYLGLWEDEMGLPKNLLGMSVGLRRTFLLNRRSIAAFTRTRRRLLVELFIIETFGDVVEFTVDGIALTAGGVPLFDDAGDVSTLYSITEDITNFSYEVWVDSGQDIDQDGLERELGWITPSWISWSITRVP